MGNGRRTYSHTYTLAGISAPSHTSEKAKTKWRCIFLDLYVVGFVTRRFGCWRISTRKFLATPEFGKFIISQTFHFFHNLGGKDLKVGTRLAEFQWHIGGICLLNSSIYIHRYDFLTMCNAISSSACLQPLLVRNSPHCVQHLKFMRSAISLMLTNLF